MSYTDLTTEFDYKDLLTWQNMDKLAENDEWLKENFMNYRRPVLQWASVTAVNVENNTGTQHQTRIVFPDGEIRDVTEDVSSTHKYRQFIITAAAEFTSGTEDSGIRSGIAEADNTWYAIYAVKSTINTANFVLAGDTTLPTRANFATLNTRYGTSSWVYLGMIRNGDSNAIASSILDFVQAGNMTLFKNALGASSSGNTSTGILFANSASSGGLTYTYAAGTGDLEVPTTISHAVWNCGFANAAVGKYVRNAANTVTYSIMVSTAATSMTRVLTDVASGIQLVPGSGNEAMDIAFSGFVDGALGVGPNPVL